MKFVVLERGSTREKAINRDRVEAIAPGTKGNRNGSSCSLYYKNGECVEVDMPFDTVVDLFNEE